MRSFFAFTGLVAISAMSNLSAQDAASEMEVTPLFEPAGDSAQYRFPGIVQTASGNLVSYAEGRKDMLMAWSSTAPFIRVSEDGGKTWSDAVEFASAPEGAEQNPVMVERGVAPEGAIGVHNLTAIPDKDGGIHWLYNVEYNRTFYVKSDDKGVKQGDAVEITEVFDAFKSEVDWKLLAVGPASGIQHSKTGRLIVPVWVSDGVEGVGLQNAATATIYSDDNGATWNRGEIIAANFPLENIKTGTKIEMPSEGSVAEAADGSVVINIRNKALKGLRAQSTSADGATGWSEAVFVDGLSEPICYGSLTSAGDAILFANPNNMIMRKSLTIYKSTDGGKTYPASMLIDDGAAAYSDMTSDGETVHLVYEKGIPSSVVYLSFPVSKIE